MFPEHVPRLAEKILVPRSLQSFEIPKIENSTRLYRDALPTDIACRKRQRDVLL